MIWIYGRNIFGKYALDLVHSKPVTEENSGFITDKSVSYSQGGIEYILVKLLIYANPPLMVWFHTLLNCLLCTNINNLEKNTASSCDGCHCAVRRAITQLRLAPEVVVSGVQFSLEKFPIGSEVMLIYESSEDWAGGWINEEKQRKT